MTVQGYPGEDDYLRILSRYREFAEGAIRRLGDGRREYLGDPSSVESGLRSQGNHVFVCALLAAGEAAGGPAWFLARARAGLAYMCAGHGTGGGACADGGRWGRTWQSSWWAAKLAAGARLIWDRLEEGEREAAARVVADEADRHLDRRAASGLFVDTKAEENAWDAEVLAWALALRPGHEHAPRWREKLIEFLLNTFSAPQDRGSAAVVDGRPLKERVHTANTHADHTLENHGAYHFCYHASPLASFAWAHLAFVLGGADPPEAALHRVAEVWAALKPTFLENRFAYIGGKDWPRYTYGLAFIVPALVLIQARLGDPEARTVEAARVAAFAREQERNGDGSLFGRRFSRGRRAGLAVEIETDAFAALGLACLLHRRLAPALAPVPLPELHRRHAGIRICPEGLYGLARTPRLFASFSWRTQDEPFPIALFIPDGLDDAAEWQANNLLGRVDPGPIGRTLWIQSMAEEGGRLVVEGVALYFDRRGEMLNQHIRFVVDTREEIAWTASRFVARRRLWIRRSYGLALHVANDDFNGRRRTFLSDRGALAAEAEGRRLPAGGGLGARLARRVRRVLDAGSRSLPCGERWVNVEGRLGVVALQPAGGFALLRSPAQVAAGSLHYEVLTCPRRRRWYFAGAGEEILATSFLLVAGDEARTARLAASVARDGGPPELATSACPGP